MPVFRLPSNTTNVGDGGESSSGSGGGQGGLNLPSGNTTSSGSGCSGDNTQKPKQDIANHFLHYLEESNATVVLVTENIMKKLTSQSGLVLKSKGWSSTFRCALLSALSADEAKNKKALWEHTLAHVKVYEVG